ncbi:replication protein A 70 kDa DNA-binding subunit B-like [Tasmannia lanceolata]|uniref:replication protein A 70 kDa DNA-binding subunit B-like n=1 Tax=Tasmannia lanceolata TaxID=3420 RepID=UPI0040628120
MVETSPIVAIKSLKVGDFHGVSVSALSKSSVLINLDVPESKKLRSWYDSEGKGASMASVGSSMISNSSKSGARSMYSDRSFLLTLPVTHLWARIRYGFISSIRK